MIRTVAILLGLSLAACAPEPVETVVLTPDTPEIGDLLRQADARWEAAGIAADRIVIGPGGAPVTLVEVLPNAPAEAIGRTVVRGRGGTYVGVRRMELTGLDLHNVTHEMGHALGMNSVTLDEQHIEGPECDDAAPNRPLMCQVGGPSITSLDLDVACSQTQCTHYTPEAD